jgi:hypothetical protein
MSDQGELGLLAAFTRSEMSYQELWWRQLSVGGDTGLLELEACLLGLLTIDPYQHDVIAQALNEHFLDRGEDHPVAYSSVGDGLRPPWET